MIPKKSLPDMERWPDNNWVGRDPRTGNIDADHEYWETQAGSQPMTSICYLVNISGYIGYIV